MRVYKCDGESFSTGKKCANEAEDELPTRWLSISGNIKNGLYDAHYIECNGVRHFCSRKCLENFLFKDVNPPQGNAALNNMFDPGTQQPGDELKSNAEGAAIEAKAPEAEANQEATETVTTAEQITEE